MPLTPQESSELEFVNILKSKHARYIDGVRVIDADAVADDYVPPGAAIGKITGSGQYGPVTRDKVAAGGATASTNVIPLKNLNANDWHNWQVGDEIICDPGETNEETATITSIDEAAGELTVDSISTDHAENVIIQKNDGTSTAEFVCTELADVSDEDAIVGGIVHGAVYSDRMPNYDAIVAEDLPMISFE
jgi:hypothetical protein